MNNQMDFFSEHSKPTFEDILEYITTLVQGLTKEQITTLRQALDVGEGE